MYRADAHFRIGTSHEAEHSPCQDYALAVNEERPFAVVSDGCSTSGLTDIGARVWALAARRAVAPFWHHPSSSRIVTQVLSGMFALGLNIEDMDATLGVVAQSDGGDLVGTIWGDGVIAARTTAGLDITTVTWAGNMPGYPSYLINVPRCEEFTRQSNIAAGGSDRPCRVTRTVIRPDGSTLPFSDTTTTMSVPLGLCGITVAQPAETEIVAVLTDGAAQIPGIDLFSVVDELLTVGPAREGFFMRRRLNAVLKKFAKSGARPTDDISIAALVRVGADV
jgi:Protein phosphatase 2C